MSVPAVVDKVFEAIDNHRLPHAEQLLDGLLAEHGGDPLVRAAHALLVFRQDFRAKGRTMAEALVDEGHVDKLGTAVSALTFVLQNTCSWDHLLRVYESLLPKRKDDTALLENLCTTYIQLKRFNNVQRTAMQLFQLTHSTMHQTWAIMANLFAAPPGEPDHLLLKIATRSIEQQLEANKATYQVAGMYVEALRRQNRPADALAFVVSKRGALLGTDATRFELIHEFQAKLGNIPVARAAALHLWRDLEPDNWTYFQLCVDTLTKEISGEPTAEVELNLTTAEGKNQSATVHVLSSLTELDVVASTCAVAQEGEEKKLRGPFLAELEVGALLLADAKLSPEAFADRLRRYLSFFSTKSCCIWDVAKYSALLGNTGSSQRDWYAGVLPPSPLASSEEDDLGKHYQHILRLQLDLVGLTGQADQAVLESECHRILNAAVEGLKQGEPLSAALAWSEEGKVDAYSVVAMNAAVRVYAATKKSEWIHLGLAAIAAAPRAKNNPILMLLSTLGHALLNIVDESSWHQLDMKSMQYDSMALVGLHTLLEKKLSCKLLATRIKGSERYYAGAPRELSTVRGKVFHHVAPTKQLEVNQFEDALRTSIARLESHVLHGAVELMQCETRKDLLKHLSSLQQSLEFVRTVGDDEVKCFHDSKVVQSVLYTAVGTSKNDGETLADILLPPLSLPARIAHVRIGWALLCVLHDTAAAQLDKEERTRRQQGMPKKKKDKKHQEPPRPSDAASALKLFGVDAGAVFAQYGAQVDKESSWGIAVELLRVLCVFLQQQTAANEEALVASIKQIDLVATPGLLHPHLSLVVASLGVAEGKAGTAAAKELLDKMRDYDAILSKQLEDEVQVQSFPVESEFATAGLDCGRYRADASGKVKEQIQSHHKEVRRLMLELQMTSKRK